VHAVDEERVRQVMMVRKTTTTTTMRYPAERAREMKTRQREELL